MADVTCTRCGQTREGFERPPFPGAIGARIVGEICKDCWAQWLKQQTMLINHYGLNVMEPQARTFLTRNMEGYLFKTGATDDVDTSQQGTISH
jgi:Fe-S cluster biosynthesis and repair protein YggX